MLATMKTTENGIKIIKFAMQIGLTKSINSIINVYETIFNVFQSENNYQFNI